MTIDPTYPSAAYDWVCTESPDRVSDLVKATWELLAVVDPKEPGQPRRYTLRRLRPGAAPTTGRS